MTYFRIQNLRDAGTEVSHRFHDNHFEVVTTLKNYSSIKFLFGGLLANIPRSNYFFFKLFFYTKQGPY